MTRTHEETQTLRTPRLLSDHRKKGGSKIAPVNHPRAAGYDASIPEKERIKWSEAVGRVFGRLTVLVVGDHNGTRRKITCQCSCGVEVIVRHDHLATGDTQSCGCYKRQQWAEACTTHGGYRTTEYNIWALMHQRTTNPRSVNFKYYGPRGIAVCERWRSFELFLADVGRRPSAAHTLDRIDNDGDYCPENCRWATREQQANNTRHNRILVHEGESLTVSQWARRIGVPRDRLFARLRRGWTPTRVLTEFVKAKKQLPTTL